MPIGDIAGEVIGGLFRVIFQFIAEVLVHGTGYFLIRLVRPKSDPGDTACAVVGLLFWALVIVGAVLISQRAVVA